jgi:hypothetical protein
LERETTNSRPSAWDVASALLLALQFAVAGWAASGKSLWHDEIFTVLLARLPDTGALIAALGQGVDLHPPLSYWIIAMFDRLPGPEEMRLRLPSMLAYLGFLLTMRATGRLWMGPAGGLLTVSAGCLTGAWVYSFECRPYALMLACAGGAVYAWLQIRRGSRLALALLAFCCLLATANHYFGVLIPLVLALGEVSAMLLCGQPFYKARWLALAAAAPPLLFPLLHWRELHAYQSGYWGQGIASAVVSYRLVGWAAIPLAAAVVLRVAHRKAWPVPVPERILVFGLLAAPVFVWLLSEAAGSGFAPYHSMVVTVGAILGAVALLAGHSLRMHQAAALLTALLSVAYLPFQQEHSAWWFRTGNRAALLGARPIPEAQRRFPTLPVLVEYGAEFLAITYRYPHSGVLYLNEPALARQYIETDTTELAFARLSGITPLGLPNLHRFATWPEILVVPGERGWLRKYLKANGYSMSVVNDFVLIARRP